MLKLLFWGLVLYFVYRWVQIKRALADGNKQQKFQERQNNHHSDEGEYIDYEELK